jgi:uncharacterized protein (AIM24 family)
VLLRGTGALVHRQLSAGEILRVSPGTLVAFEETCSFDVQMVSGAKNIFFGQGLFLATLIGPGQVWLQGLPFDRVIDAVHRALPHS